MVILMLIIGRIWSSGTWWTWGLDLEGNVIVKYNLIIILAIILQFRLWTIFFVLISRWDCKLCWWWQVRGSITKIPIWLLGYECCSCQRVQYFACYLWPWASWCYARLVSKIHFYVLRQLYFLNACFICLIYLPYNTWYTT